MTALAVSAAAPAVIVDRLTAGYAPRKPILRDISLTVPAGECWAIIGPSGGGKTTLLRAVLGLVRPQSGSVTLPGMQAHATMRSGTIGYIPQQLGLVRNLTVRQNVLLGGVGKMSWTRTIAGMFSGDDVDRAEDALTSVGLAGRGKERVTALSGGERRRVAIARTLVQRPRILLADEFLAEVDRVTAESILDLLARVRADTGMTVLCVEHNLEAACRIAHRLVVLAGGRKLRELAPCDAGCEDACELFRAVATA